MNQVVINKTAQRQLKKVPAHIAKNFRLWVVTVETVGIAETRKISGFHDEPLERERKGQRSVRLSRSYRAFYVEHGDTIIIEVIEVNKHDY